MDTQFLESLDRWQIESLDVSQIPVKKLLVDSLYYPSSGNDGGPVKYMNTRYAELGINSYVFCDYHFGQTGFEFNKDTFRGYHLVGSVSEAFDSPNELMFLGEGYRLTVPPMVTREEYTRYEQLWHPFIGWAVYERDEGYGPEWGPHRFSLLYIGAEGVATYQMLYWQYNIIPKALCFVQDGAAFGFNWTSYRCDYGPMQWVVRHHPSGQQPQWVIFGGTILVPFEWKEYKKVDIITNYYGRSGVAALFKDTGNRIFSGEKPTCSSKDSLSQP